MGEEYGSERLDAEFVWVLDPIDGTKSFIAGMPGWGTLIGLLRNGQPCYGMMHQPFTRSASPAMAARQGIAARSASGRYARAPARGSPTPCSTPPRRG